MPDADDSVIEQLAARRSRARREPPPRRPARGAPVPPEVTGDATAPAASERTARAQQVPTRPVSPTPTGTEHSSAQRSSTSSADARKSRPSSTSKEAPGGEDPIQLQADEPIANFAVRVRRSLDDLVAWRLAELRRQGVRTTKVELTEMLLWELGSVAPGDFQQRLAVFRQHAPR